MSKNIFSNNKILNNLNYLKLLKFRFIILNKVKRMNFLIFLVILFYYIRLMNLNL